MGRCLRPRWKLTSNVSFAPGLPRTNAQGLAQGEPRGHLDRGSNRGRRLAGNVVEVHFVRRLAAKPSVRPRLVVPFDRCGEFLQERFASIGHERQAREQALDRQDDSLDDGNRTVLADGSVTRPLDALAFAPFSEGIAVELLAAIANDVLGDCLGASTTRCPHPRPLSQRARGVLGLGNRSSQEAADGFTVWLVLERHDTHHSSGEVVDDDRHPVAEWPSTAARRMAANWSRSRRWAPPSDRRARRDRGIWP